MSAQVSSTPVQAEFPPQTAAPQANFRWLWRYLVRYKWSAILSITSGMIGGAATAAGPYFIGRVIDDLRRGEGIDRIGMDIFIFLGISLLVTIAFFGQRLYSGYVAYSVDISIRSDLFGNLLTLDQGFYQRHPVGDLISRMHSDIENIWRLMAITFTRIGSAVFTLFTAFILLAVVNLPLALVVFVTLSISTRFQFWAGKALTPMFEKVQDQAGVMSALVQDSVSGIQTIKTFHREAGAAQKYAAANREYRQRWLYFRRRNEPVGMLPNMISETTAGIVVLFGGILTLNGAMSLGNFAQFLIYLNYISQALLQIGTIYQRFQTTRGALRRLTPLLSIPGIRDAADAQPLPSPQGAITLEKVSVDLWGKRLLKDISLHIPAGKTVAFVGPTGCGKTLLVSLLARILDPVEGRILIDSVDVRQIRLSDLRQAVAYVPQNTFLFSQPLHFNVKMSRENLENEALLRAVLIAGVAKDLPQLPNGIDTLVGERGVMLSGGQKQRVAIARALVHEPAILVLDDALSSVDTHTAAEILANLRQVLRTRTSIIIAHRVATVKDADCIYVMDDGRIVEQGNHDELIALNQRYARMVERELREETEKDFENE
ncbi:MAG: ABC transporter ATP-binding protein [Anaerolineae bacterium]|nr:ABC transporter ATP-binding protein [Anaerolineae bacterium]